uniref:Movement protein n=1 Tax=Chenopodium quinoa TaxID=63459 RepID=A0A803LTW8_CHEQI
MATKLTNEVEGNSQIVKNLDGWKFPKISVDQLYKRNIFKIFPTYVVRDFEKTISLKALNQDVSTKLLSRDVLKGFIKRQHRFMHLGLVQIAVKPLIRDGLGGPIVVCLRDARISNFENSLLALVESNLSQGPLYFNCFPSFSVSLNDASSLEALTLCVKTGGVPLALTYRVVCKAMENLSSDALKGPILGDTTYFQLDTGIQTIIKWDEVQIPESWTCTSDP